MAHFYINILSTPSPITPNPPLFSISLKSLRNLYRYIVDSSVKYLSDSLLLLSTHLSFYLSIYLPFNLSNYQSISLYSSLFKLNINQPITQFSIFLSMYVSITLSIFLSIYLYIFITIYLSKNIFYLSRFVTIYLLSIKQYSLCIIFQTIYSPFIYLTVYHRPNRLPTFLLTYLFIYPPICIFICLSFFHFPILSASIPQVFHII